MPAAEVAGAQMIGPKRRDHRDEHEGCTAMWPWLPGCRKYWRVDGLIATATEDVKAMPAEDRDFWMRNVIARRTRRGLPSRWHLKGEYASTRERWRYDEYRFTVGAVRRLAEAIPSYLEGMTLEERAEAEWTLKVQRLALEVLCMYGAPIPGPQ